jgi:L-seryl-tRNA(Ser) seleniumtransferase
MLDRRTFLGFAGALPNLDLGVGQIRGEFRPSQSVYEELGLRPCINAAGAYTELGGALMPEEVVEAMEEASRRSIPIIELQQAIGRKIALMLRCPAALVTAGCASSLSLATAACVAGKDLEKIRRLPNTAGMKDEVIVQKAHRFEYDHAIRNVGVHLVEVETQEGLKAAVTQRTAMLFFVHAANPKGAIRREEFAQLGAALGVPTLIDAAADLPPVENLWMLSKLGYDLVAFSGGKSLRGPQCSGLLLGKQELIEAAALNASPHTDTLGRVSKVGKEEIVGLYRALELFLKTDHDAEWVEWEHRVMTISRPLSAIPGVAAEMVVPEVPHHRPQVHVRWDQEEIKLSPKDVVQLLRSGNPRIELPPGSENSPSGLDIAVWMLRPDEATVVAERFAEVLTQRKSKKDRGERTFKLDPRTS